MSKNNNRHPQKAMGNPPKKTGNAFLRYAYDKRIMLPVICFFCVAIVALSVLLILDSTGILYSGHGNVQGGDSVSAGNVELTDGVIHTSGNYQYRLLKDGTAELYYYTAHTSTEVDIPSKIDGYSISVIGKEAFVWMATLNSVTIPEGVTVIDSSAFEGCGNLQTLKLPKTLTTVADNAFLNCPSNMKVTSQVPVSELKIGTGNSALLASVSKSEN